jgi:hypothetical protein
LYICNAYSFTHINLIPTFRIASKPILAQRISLCALSGNYMENQKEIWKTIDGYENYQISNLGNVKSLDRIRNGVGTFKNCSIKGRILKPMKTKKGYLVVDLRNYNIRKITPIHRLVAIAFIDNIENKPQVNHINGIKTDNRLDNLEWCTNSENQIHSYNILLRKRLTGEKNGFSKLKNNEILEIRNNKNKLKTLAEMYNVSITTISDIKNNKIWKHI